MLLTEQILLSDRVLLNKIDTIPEQELSNLSRVIQNVNRVATIIPCERGDVDLREILDVDSFSLKQAMEIDEYFAELMKHEESGAHTHSSLSEVSEEDEEHHKSGAHHHSESNHSPHQHDVLGFCNVGLEISSEPFDWQAFQKWLAAFVKENEGVLVRVKGVLWVSSEAPTRWAPAIHQRAVIQGVYGHFEKSISLWPEDGTQSAKLKKSRIVFIGTFQQEFRQKVSQGLDSCLLSTVRKRNTSTPTRQHPFVAKEQYGSSKNTVETQNFTSQLENSLQPQSFATKLGNLKFQSDDFASVDFLL